MGSVVMFVSPHTSPPLCLCLLVWEPSQALQCYSCGGDNSKAGCDGFKPSPLFTEMCAPSQTSCLSTIAELDDIKVESRGCGTWRGPGPPCVSRSLGGGSARATLCSCREDSCNLATLPLKQERRTGIWKN